MTESEILYKNQMEAWIATQKLNISSCDLNIEYYSKQINVLKQSIDGELNEKELKQKLLTYHTTQHDEWLKTVSE
jgi:hypothetical protein